MSIIVSFLLKWRANQLFFLEMIIGLIYNLLDNIGDGVNIRSMRKLFLSVGALLLVSFCLWTTQALACACCDQIVRRRVIGWKADGSAVIDRNGDGCDSARMVEFVKPKRKVARNCQCWNSSEKGKCKKLANIDDGLCLYGHEKQNRKRFDMSIDMQSPVYLDSSQLFVAFENRRDAKSDEPVLWVRVMIKDGDAWFVLHREKIADATGDALSKLEFDRQVIVGASVALHPTSDTAILVLRGINTSPGTGTYESFLRWVDVPKRFREKTKPKEHVTRAKNVAVDVSSLGIEKTNKLMRATKARHLGKVIPLIAAGRKGLREWAISRLVRSCEEKKTFHQALKKSRIPQKKHEAIHWLIENKWPCTED